MFLQIFQVQDSFARKYADVIVPYHTFSGGMTLTS
jgi:hypothetical protein